MHQWHYQQYISHTITGMVASEKYIAHVISKISLDCIHFEIKTYSASGGCAPRPLHLGSTTNGNLLSEFQDPPLEIDKNQGS